MEGGGGRAKPVPIFFPITLYYVYFCKINNMCIGGGGGLNFMTTG